MREWPGSEWFLHHSTTMRRVVQQKSVFVTSGTWFLPPFLVVLIFRFPLHFLRSGGSFLLLSNADFVSRSLAKVEGLPHCCCLNFLRERSTEEVVQPLYLFTIIATTL